MAKPKDRLGVFSVAVSHDKQLLAEETAADEAMFDEPRKRWYQLRHDLFEHLLRVAETHRVVTSAVARDAFVKLVEAVGPNKTWDNATPKQRRELARKHLGKVRNRELRAAISAVIKHPGDFGLWIVTEAKLPPEPKPSVDDGVEVDVNETIRLLDAYIAEQDWKQASKSLLEAAAAKRKPRTRRRS
jgi:hypothetical protein